MDKNHIVFIVMDSCRYDTLVAASTPNIDRTADHGELFGEDGYFGHGPIMHEKCFEIPYVEGKVKEAASAA